MNATWRDNFRQPGALARFLLTAIVGLALDLWTKELAFAHLATSPGPKPASRVYELVPGWLHLMVTTNPGAVFGIGQGRQGLFLFVSLLAVGFLIYLFAVSGHQRLLQLILGLLLAGVLGNLCDRLRFGHVRDMIHALPGWQWAGSWSVPVLGYPGPERLVFPWIFNVADVFLCTGVGLMLLHGAFRPHGRSHHRQAGARARAAS